MRWSAFSVVQSQHVLGNKGSSGHFLPCFAFSTENGKNCPEPVVKRHARITNTPNTKKHVFIVKGVNELTVLGSALDSKATDLHNVAHRLAIAVL